MAKYILQPDEGIILKSTRVRSMSRGFWDDFGDEIMLTNLNFVWTSVVFFGFRKEIHKYPLDQIKVFNGRTQVFLGEHSGNKSPILEVYFTSGQVESFGFQVSEKEAKKEIWKWIKAINVAVTGNELDDEEEVKPDDSLLGRFREIGTELKEAFFGPSKGERSTKPDIAKSVTPEKVDIKCNICGAPISGLKGKIVQCPYCDADHQL
jgi:hypothetical protein